MSDGIGAVGQRHLAQSSLFTEDVRVGGHTAVWGSFFNREHGKWGYACCRGTSREEPCPFRKPLEEVTDGAPCAALAADDIGVRQSSSDDEGENRVAATWAACRLLDEVPPAQLEPRSACTSDEEYLSRFVLYWFRAWNDARASGNSDQKSVQQTREALLNLLQLLRKKAVQKDLVSKLADFADLASQREYAKANDVYVGMTIGKALWHTHLDLGQQRAHWGGGSSLRTMQRQVVEKDHKNSSLFDSDPAVQRYVHAVKRLVTYMQSAHPSDDPSKLGHVPAEAPKPSDLGLPVQRHIRDSDGHQRLPEYVEPSEADAACANRGLAFGDRADRSHPFSAIGSARGI
eukprot:TRINITY_DN57683_c0_g1_i1.p1 TRINITY_DN57683_c0_g1~~TRINITY_DN57683_c0_g1_i1.p1  ORF type:complete len:346 (+),score=62.64 TRINITY_DN57683_c0_g1_i1:52-1089(+)